MIRSDYIAAMERALHEQYGLRLTFPDPFQRARAARRFYRIREQLREDGDSSFDILSVMKCGDIELLIFRRDKIANPPRDDGVLANDAPLTANDLPTEFRRPRGPQKSPPIMELLAAVTHREK